MLRPAGRMRKPPANNKTAYKRKFIIRRFWLRCFPFVKMMDKTRPLITIETWVISRLRLFNQCKGPGNSSPGKCKPIERKNNKINTSVETYKSFPIRIKRMTTMKYAQPIRPRIPHQLGVIPINSPSTVLRKVNHKKARTNNPTILKEVNRCFFQPMLFGYTFQIKMALT